ncbi:MAG: hypothetical protein J0L77_06145 [Alphaproteobacteria bacterium]|nr:hypothetical protein [Alphaproteobacteria bacterium]
MLDTVVLTLPEKDFLIRHGDRFTPSAGFLQNPMYVTNQMVKAVYNPTNAEKRTGYKPRLTLIKKPFTERVKAIFLRVEFSAPKLLYGNNFVELRGHDDFMPVLTALHTALASMGIAVSLETLKAASLSAIHYSKNILLERETPCFLLIRELEKLDLSAKLDLTQTDFRNSGQMVKYHASTYEIALYDKVKDLQQASTYGDKRSAEVDNASQLDLLNSLKLPEVLRFEIRLKSRKLKPLLAQIGYTGPLTFQNLFNASLSRAVLLHFWSQITDGLYLLNLNSDDPAALIARIKTAHPRKRQTSILQLIGFAHTAEKLGIRGAKLHLGLNNQTFYRMKKDLKALDGTHTTPRFSILKAVKGQITEFIPLIADDVVKTDLLEKRG